MVMQIKLVVVGSVVVLLSLSVSQRKLKTGSVDNANQEFSLALPSWYKC